MYGIARTVTIFMVKTYYNKYMVHERLGRISSPEQIDDDYDDASKLAVQGLQRYVERNISAGTHVVAHEEGDSRMESGVKDKSETSLDGQSDEREEYSRKYREFEIFPLPQEIMKSYEFIKDLPRDVGVMGGMARSIARKIIAGEDEPIRDIDLVYIKNDESEPDWETLDELSQKYMPDDYAYGHGMQTDELENYFDSRDLTVNECLILNGALVVSNFAYNDLQENIIRPTYYEMRDRSQSSTGRNTMRALAMQATLTESTKSYPTLEDFNVNPFYIPSFEMAVQLNKTMSRGAEVACNFTNLLADYNMIPAELAGQPKAVARYLLEYKVENFYFRANDDEKLRVKVDGEGDKFQQPGAASAEYHISDPAIKEAIGEYDDDLTTERYSGHYTQEEFEEINRHHFRYEYADEDEDDWYYEDEEWYDEDEDEE